MSEYIPLIDTLIGNQPATRSSCVVNQLQSFLNQEFDHALRHKVKKLVHKRRAVHRAKQEKSKTVQEKAVSVHRDLLVSLVESKLRSQCWLDLLYTQNVDQSSPSTVSSGGYVDTEAPSTTEAPDIGLVQMENVSLLYRLDHSLNLHTYIPSREQYGQSRKLEARRRKAMARYATYQDSLFQTNSPLSTPLFSWSENITNLLHIEQPLSLNEVVYLLFRYIKENKLRSGNIITCDENIRFLQHDEVAMTAQSLFKAIAQNKIRPLGHIEPSGSRCLSNGDPLPVALYNVTEEQLLSLTQLRIKQPDITASFQNMLRTNTKPFT